MTHWKQNSIFVIIEFRSFQNYGYAFLFTHKSRMDFLNLINWIG